MKNHIIILLAIVAVCISNSCFSPENQELETSCSYAGYFDVVELNHDGRVSEAVIVISPFNNSRDTLIVEEPLGNIICMSSSQVAGLKEIGVDSVITAVSGLRYITNSNLHLRKVCDIGYDASLNYEKILSLKPDVLLAYTVSGAEPPYIKRLRSLGIRVLVINDHLENHPLARAEYMRLYGVLTGHRAYADSMFTRICARYDSLKVSVDSKLNKKRVLMNVPYGDAWYIPGGRSYMARLIQDAGGEVLGADWSSSTSRIIRMEEAYDLSLKADMWLNPGVCCTRADLIAFHHAFQFFGPIKNSMPIYNNTLRMTPEGGNDFWESGSVRPDLILEDLVAIFADDHRSSLKYYFEVK